MWYDGISIKNAISERDDKRHLGKRTYKNDNRISGATMLILGMIIISCFTATARAREDMSFYMESVQAQWESIAISGNYGGLYPGKSDLK